MRVSSDTPIGYTLSKHTKSHMCVPFLQTSMSEALQSQQNLCIQVGPAGPATLTALSKLVSFTVFWLPIAALP